MRVDSFLKISAIICTKDRPDGVLRCLDSILIQSYLPDEIIIVDAGQGFELCERLNDWTGKEKFKLVYVRSEPGLPHQRNVGVSESSGEIIFFFDDDIVLEGAYIEEIIKVFSADPTGEIGGVMGDIYEARVSRQTWAWWQHFLRAIFLLPHFGDGRFLASGAPAWPYGTDEARPTEFLCGGQVAYRRQVLGEYKFDGALKANAPYEDVDFSYRVSRTYRNMYTPLAKCSHLEFPVADTNDAKIRRRANFAYVSRKNLPPTMKHRIAFWIALQGWRIVPRIEYYAWRIEKAIKGELPWTKRNPGIGKG